ncbi:MAG: hypothetical protein LBS45_06410 [Synergistaceae bacterium]|nr:hypothetical protein [Synergistaceae bacterium]
MRKYDDPIRAAKAARVLYSLGRIGAAYLFDSAAGLFSAFRKVSPCFIFRHVRAAFRVLYSYLMNFVTVEYHRC